MVRTYCGPEDRKKIREKENRETHRNGVLCRIKVSGEQATSRQAECYCCLFHLIIVKVGGSEAQLGSKIRKNEHIKGRRHEKQ